MADDSLEIIEPLDFHPCDSPRGMLYYDLSLLTTDQQAQVNDFKRNLIRDNEKYLAGHPEIRAIVALVTRYILHKRPRSGLPELVGCFFSRPKPDLEEEIRQYVQAREPHISEGDSAVIIHEESSDESSESVFLKDEEEEEIENLEDVPRKVLDEILKKAYARLGIDLDDTDDWVPPDLTNIDFMSDSVVDEIVSDTLKGSRVSDQFSYLEENLSRTEDLETGFSEIEPPSASEPTTEVIMAIIPEESPKSVGRKPIEPAVTKAPEVVQKPADSVQEPNQDVAEEPKSVAFKEPKQENVEQSPPESTKETVVTADQPQVEEALEQ